MDILKNLRWRGLVQDVSHPSGTIELPAGTPFYVGFDPTAQSLQLGNLVPLIVTAHLAKEGLTPIILFGGATGSIGDPSGKSEERKLLESEVIFRNVERQTAQVQSIFSRLGLEAQFVNNLDWTKEVTALHFLRDVGKYFTVNYMLAKEVVKSRIESSGISFTEFSYMLLQAFDYYHLFETKGCRLQIGGSDQWGNITAGLEYIRKRGQKEAFAFSFPLITNAQGKKFGKSEQGAIWLDSETTSPYRFHQFWLNQDDTDVIRLLKVFTFLEEEEIASLELEVQNHPEKRAAQRMLADAVCTLVHGPQATQEANKSAEVLFGGDVAGLTASQLEEIFAEVPSVTLASNEASQLTLLDLFVRCGASKSKGEAKRLFANGGAYLNNVRLEDGTLSFSSFFNQNSPVVVLRSGKKNYFLVKVEP